MIVTKTESTTTLVLDFEELGAVVQGLWLMSREDHDAGAAIPPAFAKDLLQQIEKQAA